MKTLSRLVLPALLLASAGSAARAPAPSIPDIHLRPAEAGWRVEYRFAGPVREFFLLRNPDDSRGREWRSADPALRIVHEEGRDIVRRQDGQAFSEASFELPARFVVFDADYAPFSPFTDGGVLIHSGRFHACAVECPKDAQGTDQPWRFSLEPPAGTNVIVAGELHEGRAEWLDSGSGTMVYAGKGRPIETAHLLAVVDPGLPEEARELLENLLPALVDHFAQRLQAPAEKPMLFASHDPGSDDGRYGSKGGTLPGQVFMHFYGAGWDDPDRAGWLRRWMPWFFAHEAAHLFQQYERSADPAASWIHEGGAEAFAYLALQGMPGSGIPGDFLDEKLEQAASACAEGLKQGSLADAQADGRFHNHYECGLVMQLALHAAVVEASHGRQGLFELWRSYIERTGAGAPWSVDTFLAVAREFAGEEIADQLHMLATRQPVDAETAMSTLLARARQSTNASP